MINTSVSIHGCIISFLYLDFGTTHRLLCVKTVFFYIGICLDICPEPKQCASGYLRAFLGFKV